jgi:glycosyltransferase involved in cell wall biosynthesis
MHYVYQPNAGTAAARNRGAALARGDCLAFLDQDDLWLPDKLAVQMDALAADPSLDLVLGHVWQGAFPAGTAAADLLASHAGRRLAGYLPSTLLVRREAFAAMGGFAADHALTEAFDWFVRARERGLRQQMLPQVVALRRVHGANKGRSQRHARAEYARVLKHSLDRRRNGTGAAQTRP